MQLYGDTSPPTGTEKSSSFGQASTRLRGATMGTDTTTPATAGGLGSTTSS